MGAPCIYDISRLRVKYSIFLMIDIFIVLLLTCLLVRVALDCVPEHVALDGASSIQLFFCLA